MNAGSGASIALPGRFVTPADWLVTSERRNDIRRWYATMPQDIDGAIARWRRASGAALRNRLTMRPANAAKRRRVALRPGRGAKAPDGAPDDDQFQVRKVAAFSCRLWPGSPSRHIRRASSGKCEATLKGTVGEIVALIIRVSATLFRIVQGGPQSCDAPGRNDFEGCRVHLVPPLDRCSPTMQGRKWLYPEVPLNYRQVLPARCVGCGRPVTRSHQASARASNV